MPCFKVKKNRATINSTPKTYKRNHCNVLRDVNSNENPFTSDDHFLTYPQSHPKKKYIYKIQNKESTPNT